MGDNFGMMEGAYFVGRNELLTWLNDLLQLGYTKVEQTCSGASHCQVMDAIYPGKVPLSKVNFNAKFEYEYVKNYKVLQEIFNKVGVERFIDVQKLIKGKYQDNLEFLQWIKRYFDLHYPGDTYNAVERRRESKCPYEGDGKTGDAAPAPASKPVKSDSGGMNAAPGRVKPSRPAAPAATGAAAAPPAKATTALKPVNRDTSKPADKPSKPAQPQSSDAKAVEAEYKGKLNDMNSQVVSLKLTIDNLEKERDFYFNKLREVEILCQNSSNPSIIEDVLKILYATDDENFVAENTVADE